MEQFPEVGAAVRLRRSHTGLSPPLIIFSPAMGYRSWPPSQLSSTGAASVKVDTEMTVSFTSNTSLTPRSPSLFLQLPAKRNTDPAVKRRMLNDSPTTKLAHSLSTCLRFSNKSDRW